MLDIIYEDNHIIVCYKPKGILSQADGSSKKDMLTILKEYLKEKYHKPGNVYLGLVHRLDLNTSGIMVFAKTSKAAKRLSLQIQNHQFEKKYIAIVEGKIENKEFLELKSFLKKDEQQKKSLISKDGQEAILYYKSRKNYIDFNIEVSEIEIILKTGRFHQIRAQMASIGHPLLGDVKYGAKPQKDFEMPLQAYSLSFYHPTTNELLRFERLV